MPKGSRKVEDQMAEALAEILDLTNDLEKYLKDLKEKQIKIESKIDKLEQPYKNILYFRYIKGYNFTTYYHIRFWRYHVCSGHGLMYPKYTYRKRLVPDSHRIHYSPSGPFRIPAALKCTFRIR